MFSELVYICTLYLSSNGPATIHDFSKARLSLLVVEVDGHRKFGRDILFVDCILGFTVRSVIPA